MQRVIWLAKPTRGYTQLKKGKHFTMLQMAEQEGNVYGLCSLDHIIIYIIIISFSLSSLQVIFHRIPEAEGL